MTVTTAKVVGCISGLFATLARYYVNPVIGFAPRSISSATCGRVVCNKPADLWFAFIQGKYPRHPGNQFVAKAASCSKRWYRHYDRRFQPALSPG
jgi:hypothetical protein